MISPRAMSDGGQRRGQHLVVELVVLQLEEDVERRVEQRAVHRRGGEHAGRDELGVGDRVAVELEAVDQLADADADREQVEDRLEEAGEEQLPGARGRRRSCAARSSPVRLDRRRAGPSAARRGRRSTTVMSPASASRRADRQHQPTTAARPGSTTCHRRRATSRRVSRHEHPGQVDAVPQRREPGDPLQHGAEVADREERAGEQEQRDQPEPEDQRRSRSSALDVGR